jgi:hypothetical protein
MLVLDEIEPIHDLEYFKTKLYAEYNKLFDNEFKALISSKGDNDNHSFIKMLEKARRQCPDKAELKTLIDSDNSKKYLMHILFKWNHALVRAC